MAPIATPPLPPHEALPIVARNSAPSSGHELTFQPTESPPSPARGLIGVSSVPSPPAAAAASISPVGTEAPAAMRLGGIGFFRPTA